MGHRAPFTEAMVRRAVKGARDADPQSIIEVTPDGTIRILPPGPQPTKRSSEIDEWFDGKG